MNQPRLSYVAEVRLGRQRSPEHHTGDHMVPYLRSANIDADRLRLDDVKEMNFPPADQAVYALRGGDILMTEGSGSRQTVGATAMWDCAIDGTVCFQNTLLRLRPGPRLDPRYLYWWCQHAYGSGRLAEVAGGQSILHIGAETLRDERLRVPLLDEQRRIAAFLDDQTTRIDGIVASRRQQVRLLTESLGSRLEQLLSRPSTRPLKSLTDPARPIQYGIVLPGPDYPGGVPIIKGGDVAANRLSLEQLKRTDPEIEAKYPRSRLRAGDLVMAIRGSVGEVAEVPKELTGANLTQDTARIAPYEADRQWLRWVLMTPGVQSDIRRRVTGAMVTGINIESLRDVRIPNTRPEEQIALGDRAQREVAATTSHVAGLRDSLDLLQEFKGSLISAAVSGAFDVSAASGRGVPV